MMTSSVNAPGRVLIGGLAEGTLANLLRDQGWDVVLAPDGALVVDWARDVRPDLILLREDLPDLRVTDVCESLRRSPRVGHNVPILIIAADRPSPERRVAAVSAGAWDFVRYPGDSREVTVKLQSYLQAKRNLDLALAEGLVDPATGLHNRVGLARRARELGALMGRRHGALACVVFALDTDAHDPGAGAVVARATRVSDIVGTMGPREIAVLAPGTDDAGVVKLAVRVGRNLAAGGASREGLTLGTTLRAGYDAVANVRYSPVDPVELLGRASTAVRHGKPESGASWVCRYEDGSGTQGSAWTSPAILSEAGPGHRGYNA